MSKRAYSELIARSSMLVFVGRGGVGKTSCAAATALAAARMGRRVAVLTIDPAPRLGEALGIGCLEAEPQMVEVDGVSGEGSLDAMRLDTKGTFDRMVERFAPSPQIARLLLDSPLYQTIAGSLGGSESYMALQRLHEIAHEGHYQLLIVDTPPATHAAELFSAPLRLSALMDSNAISMLADPARTLARSGSRLASAGATLLLPLLERITGAGLREQVATFIAGFADVLTGITDRATEVEALLRDEHTAFVHVLQADAGSIKAATTLESTLAETRVQVQHRIVNRVTAATDNEPRGSAEQRSAGAPQGTAAAMVAMEAAIAQLRQTQWAALASLDSAINQASACTAAPLSLLPALDHDISSRSDLTRLAKILEGG